VKRGNRCPSEDVKDEDSQPYSGYSRDAKYRVRSAKQS
jgi:hypothetical protein